jgi:hypothetical protein
MNEGGSHIIIDTQKGGEACGFPMEMNANEVNNRETITETPGEALREAGYMASCEAKGVTPCSP